MLKRTILFLILNFGALAIGGIFTSDGVISEWYANLNKAPWTPPGWVFGAAWTTIMICFAFYMAKLWEKENNKTQLVILYSLQWILNISWNPVFFYYHNTQLGLVLITALTILVALFFFYYRTKLKWTSALIAPYLIWLIIATSLNGYIVVFN